MTRRSRKALDGLADDLRDHLERETEENVARGMTPEEARRRAHLALGNPALIAEDTRAVWVWRWVENLREDLRGALRSLRSSSGVTIPALLILGLGTGATTAIFSVVDAVVLRGLPFPEHDRLVAVGERRAAPAGPTDDPDALGFVAPQNYVDWVARQHTFESIAAYASGWLTLHQPGEEPESLVPQKVTAHFFDVLRVQPAVGRAFTQENELTGRDHVAVLSDGLWRRRFGGDSGIIGRTIVLDDLELGRSTYEVRGVMPPGFSYPVAAGRATDLWVPYVVPPDQRLRHAGVRTTYLQVIARLKPAVTLADAQGDMNHIGAALEAENPAWNKDSRVGVRPLIDHTVGRRTRSWMFMLLGAVAFVLLIACANIGNLLLARAVGREREVGIRSALGASRGRLVQQLMIESLLLSLAGTMVGVVIATWGIRILASSIPRDVPRVTAIALNVRVLGAAVGLALITGILFGVVPALRLSLPNLSRALKGADRTIAGGRRQRLRNALAITEVALALVLLVGAALFIGSFTSVMRIEPGFDITHVLTAQISPPVPLRSVGSVTAVANQGPAFADIAERLGRTPGILGAAATGGGVPLGGYGSSTSFTTPRRIDLTANQKVMISEVTPDYHRVLKIPLKAGRFFEPADRQGAPDVVIINEAVAERYFPHESPLGQQIGVDRQRTIVGIVGDIHQLSLEIDPRPEVYVPMSQSRVLGAELVIRTAGDPADVVPAARSAVLAVLPDVPLRNVTTLDDRVGRLVAQRRFNMLLLGLFGTLGLVIAAVGIYGLVGYLVTQRMREFGVRLALGATRARVMAMVMRQAVVSIGSGLVIGLMIAWNVSAIAKIFLFGVQPTDWRALTVACLVLAGAACVAAVLPARRAAAADPLVVLRAE